MCECLCDKNSLVTDLVWMLHVYAKSKLLQTMEHNIKRYVDLPIIEKGPPRNDLDSPNARPGSITHNCFHTFLFTPTNVYKPLEGISHT